MKLCSSVQNSAVQYKIKQVNASLIFSRFHWRRTSQNATNWTCWMRRFSTTTATLSQRYVLWRTEHWSPGCDACEASQCCQAVSLSKSPLLQGTQHCFNRVRWHFWTFFPCFGDRTTCPARCYSTHTVYPLILVTWVSDQWDNRLSPLKSGCQKNQRTDRCYCNLNP